MPIYRFAVGEGLGEGSMSSIELADQFVDLIDRLAVGPLVVRLDDLHWADRATLDVTTLALERLGSRPVVVLAAFRPPDIVPGSLLGDALGRLARAATVTRVPMSPLDAPGVARLMEITTGAAPSAEVATRVQQRAGGNPLFVTELARLAGERGLPDDAVVPDAIRDVVRSRLAQLPARATAELQVAAVLGERFDLRTVMAASERDPDDCLDALDAAIVTRILVPSDDGFRFAHALVRDAVLAEVTGLRMARLHQRAADAILSTRGDGPDEAEPIAHHRLASAAISTPAVVAKSAVRASDVARWRNALDRAHDLAEQALEVLSGVARTPEVRAVEVEALEAIVAVAYRRSGDGEFEQLAERVEAFAERVGSDSASALALFLRWGAIDETDDLSTVEASTERARAIASRAADSYAIVTSHYMLASYAALVGRIEEALHHVDVAVRASGAIDPDQRPDHVPLVMLPMVAAIVAAVHGDAEAARDHSHRRVVAWLSQRAEVDATVHGTLAFNRALIEALLDDPEAVLRETQITGSADPGLFGHQAEAIAVLRAWALARGGDSGVVDDAVAAVAAVAASRDRTLSGALQAFGGDALLVSGDARAVEVLAAARAECEQRGEVWWLSEIVRLQAEADRRFAGGERTNALLDEAERIATDQAALLVLDRIARSRAAVA